MANYIGVSRTNYFRVTDEERYQMLYQKLSGGESELYDFSCTDDAGVLWHGFGAYDSVDFYPDGKECPAWDIYLLELQKILPEDEAFIYLESGHEKLRDVCGFVWVCTKKEIRFMSLSQWALDASRDILGQEFGTTLSY